MDHISIYIDISLSLYIYGQRLNGTQLTKATLHLMYCGCYLVSFTFKILFDYILLMIVYVKRHDSNNIQSYQIFNFPKSDIIKLAGHVDNKLELRYLVLIIQKRKSFRKRVSFRKRKKSY